jgi:hypothetical protein
MPYTLTTGREGKGREEEREEEREGKSASPPPSIPFR